MERNRQKCVAQLLLMVGKFVEKKRVCGEVEPIRLKLSDPFVMSVN